MQSAPLLDLQSDLSSKQKIAVEATAVEPPTPLNENDGLRTRHKQTRERGFKGRMHKMRAPLEMAALLLLGLVGAFVHRFYYQLLNHTPLSYGKYSQEWHVRIGTGLAFVAKTGWTIAVLIAHSQQVWTTMDRKTLRIEVADAMILAPANFLKFRHLSLLRHAKTASLLALVAWCIPLSAIFTPATLTVVSDTRPVTMDGAGVPTVDFTNVTNFAFTSECDAEECQLADDSTTTDAMQFSYPSAQTVLLAAAVSTSGQIQPMVPRHPNSTYTMAFAGPAIQCEVANRSATTEIERMHALSVKRKNQNYQGDAHIDYYGFVPGRSENGTLIEIDLANIPTVFFDIGASRVPIAPEIWIRTSSGSMRETGFIRTDESSSSVCALRNTTYTVTFSFENGQQKTEIDTEYIGQPPYATALAWDPDTNMPVDAPPQLFPYQAVWVALARPLLGQFFDDPPITSLFQTPLIGSREFRSYFGNDTSSSLQPFARDQTIPEVIEELSRNLTVSLFASEQHLSSDPASVDLTVFFTGNVFHFNERTLLLSYGIAVLATIVCVIIGLLAYVANGGSRDLVYSALVKVAKDHDDGIALQRRSDSPMP